MIKRTLLAIIALWSTLAAALTLYLLDQIVHGTLYSYGLQFSYNWANPYWLHLRVIQVLLTVNIIATIVSLAFTLRASSRTEKRRAETPSIPRATKQIPITTRNVEKPRPTSATPQPLQSSATSFPHQRLAQQPNSKPMATHQPRTTPTQTTSSPSYKPTYSTVPIKCPNCGKSFTQPLRMLDFQGDTPRMIDTCPFCGKAIRNTARVEAR